MYSKFVLINFTTIAFFALSSFVRRKWTTADIQNLREFLLNHVRPKSFVVKQSGTLHHCNFYSTHFFIEHLFLTMRKFIQRRSADSPCNMRYFYHHRIFVQVRITFERPASRSISYDLTRMSARRGSKTE